MSTTLLFKLISNLVLDVQLLQLPPPGSVQLLFERGHLAECQLVVASDLAVHEHGAPGDDEELLQGPHQVHPPRHAQYEDADCIRIPGHRTPDPL